MTKAELLAEQRFPADLYGVNRDDLVFGFVQGYECAEKRRKVSVTFPRQSCHSRLACICADVRKAKGIDPFNGRRDTVAIQWRQAIVTQLRREGYSLHQIGRATCYSHSTVLYHVGRVNDALGGYDPELLDVWRELQKAIGNENTY